MEEQKFYNLTKTQETKRRRRKYPNVFFKKEIVLVFDSIEDPKTMMGAFLSFFCALRIAEVCNLRWRDIDLENKRLKVVNGKNYKDGFVPISSMCIPVLQMWRQMNQNEEFVLPAFDHAKPHFARSSLFKCYKRALARAGLEILTEKTAMGTQLHQYKFHTLRHSRCTHLLSNGVPLQKVQHFMRHDKIETTLTYTWILDAELNSMVEMVDGHKVVSAGENSSSVVMRAEDAVEILKKRLAYGEITPKEYVKLFSVLAR